MIARSRFRSGTTKEKAMPQSTVRFNHLDADRRASLNISLLIVEAIVELKRNSEQDKQPPLSCAA
ncbi:MAG: hypothetical protein WC641_03410 [Patescibacteria group bacterium]